MTGGGWGDAPHADVLENSSSLSWFGDWWSRLPPRRRRAVTGAALVLAAVAAIMLVVSQGRGWVVQQRLRDEVSLTGTMRVWAASATPAGGSVNYSVAIRNTGPRSVQITAVGIVQSRLRVTNREQSLPRLAPGETAGIDVSVRLDCTVGAEFGPQEALRGTVVGVPLSGRQHRVNITFEQSSLVTDVANILCGARPGLTEQEVSGPVLER